MTVPARQTASDPFDLEVEQTILAYLEEHPAAMDSVKGIIEWWLPRQRIRVEVGRVERVLLRQVEAGVLEAIGSGPLRRYRLRRRFTSTRG